VILYLELCASIKHYVCETGLAEGGEWHRSAQDMVTVMLDPLITLLIYEREMAAAARALGMAVKPEHK
jgi:hypothetical protein